MREINDGGPAYPCNWMDFQPATGEQVIREQFPGMSLRDYFAGQVLSGLVGGTIGPDQDAEYAYITADAMIAARNKPTK